MNFEMREQLVAQQLMERGLPGLFEVLLKLKGLVLKQEYTVRWLYAVGGQSVLYMVEKANGQMAIAKLALLSYHRAAYISIKDIQSARERLKREAELLQRFQGTVLPKFYELLYGRNPLLSKVLGQQIIEAEPYLIMELIQGTTLLDFAQLLHGSGKLDYEALEQVIWYIALAATDFSITIQESGYLYTDFSPHNFMLTNEPARPVRVLDAASLIPLEPDPALFPPLTPVYVPPDYYKAYKKGTSLWPTTSYAMYTLGKTLWESLTNLQPYPAEDPDLAEPHLKHYSDSLQDLLAALIHGEYTSFEQLKRTIEPMGQVQKKPLVEQLAGMLQIAIKEPVAPTILVEKPSTVDFNHVHGKSRVTRVQSRQANKVRVLRYSPSGKYLAIASGKRVELWDNQTFQQVRTFQSPHTMPVVSIDFDGSGQYLASGSAEGLICLWHTEADAAIWQSDVKGFSGWVALNGQADLLAVATEWSAPTFYPQRAISRGRSFDSIVDQGTCVAVGKYEPLLAVGGLWGMRLWNLNTGQEIGKNKFRVGQDFVDRIAFGNKDQTVAAVCINLNTPDSSSIIVWDTTSCEVVWHIELSHLSISDLRLSAEGRFILAGATNGHLLLWDEAQKNEIIHLTKPECGSIVAVDFAFGQPTFITASPGGEINVYHPNI